MTAALEGREWSTSRPGRTLPPGKTRYPFYRRLGGPQGRSGRAENLVRTAIRSRTVQPVVSRYSDWATRPTYTNIYIIKKHNQFEVSSQRKWILFVYLSGRSKFCLINCLVHNYINCIVLMNCVLHLNGFDFGWLCIEICSWWGR